MKHRTEAEDRAYQEGFRAAVRCTPAISADAVTKRVIEVLKERARKRADRCVTLEELEDFFK